MSLDELLAATNDVGPTRGFADRVMARVEAVPLAPAGWTVFVPRAAYRVLPVLALVAVVAVLWAWRSTRDLEDAAATVPGSVEVEW